MPESARREGVDRRADGTARLARAARVRVFRVFRVSSSREMSTVRARDGTRPRSSTGGGARSTVAAMRDVVDAGRRARLCESAWEFHHAKNFREFASRVVEARRRVVRALDALGAGRRRDGGEEEANDDDEEDDGSDTDGEAAFERVRDAIDARCDAIDAAVMVARGDEERLAGGRRASTASTTGARDGARRRRGDLVAVRPQDSFEDVVDNRLENVHHLGLTKPVGYESYEAYAEATANRPVDAYPSFARAVTPATLPTPMDDDHALEVVETPEQLEALAEHLKECKEFAADLEHHSYRSFKGFTCLMQISTRERDFVVDVLALRSRVRDALGRAFADPHTLKVMHGADNDVQWLQKDFGVFVSCLFDTGQAARELELPSKGLAYLLHHYCGVKANKKYQLADWRLRPLTKEMVEYARGDTHHLLYVYDRLKEALAARGANCVDETLRRSRDVCLKRYVPPTFDEGAYYEDLLKFDNLKELNDAQLAVYAALFSWRDAAARDADESLGYVLPRALMVRLAIASPCTERALLDECRGEVPLVATRAREVADLISRARAVGAPSFKPSVDAAATSTLARAPVSAPMATTRASKTVVDDDAATDLTKGADVVAPATTRVAAPFAPVAPKTKRKRGSMAALMGGAKKPAAMDDACAASASTVVPMSEIFDVWGADAAPAAPAADETKEPAGASPPVEEKAARVEEETIQLPGGIVVPAPLRKVNKDLPFVFPTNDDDYGRPASKADEAAAARDELAARRRERMRGYDDSDSDEDTLEDEARREMEANAKKYDSSEARAVFSNRAKELFGASGTDLLFKEEKQEKKGFNQRFKSVYEEPFKAGPKSKAFPRSGNRYTTFKE